MEQKYTDEDILQSGVYMLGALMDDALLRWQAAPIDFGELPFVDFVQMYNDYVVERIYNNTEDYYEIVKASQWFEWYKGLIEKHPILFKRIEDDDEEEEEKNESITPNWLAAMSLVYEYTGIDFQRQWQLTTVDWYAYSDYATGVTNEKLKAIKKAQRR